MQKREKGPVYKESTTVSHTSTKTHLLEEKERDRSLEATHKGRWPLSKTKN